MRFALLFLSALWLIHAKAAVPIPVFVLHAYSQEYPWTKGQHQGFVQTLNDDTSRAYSLNVEYLDTKRAGYNAQYADLIGDYLQKKYQGYQPAAIYVTDDNALSFARSQLDKVFPGVPVFFSGVNNYDVRAQLDYARTTGVFEKKEIAPNLHLMRHIDPDIREIVIVGDASETYRAIESKPESQENQRIMQHLYTRLVHEGLSPAVQPELLLVDEKARQQEILKFVQSAATQDYHAFIRALKVVLGELAGELAADSSSGTPHPVTLYTPQGIK